MRRFMHPVVVTSFVVLFLLMLPMLLPEKEDIVYSDKQLRDIALSTNLLSTPTTYKELLKVIDNPKNPMTPQKIALGKRLFSEKELSKDRDISCVSCHKLDEGGDDNIPTAIGYHKRVNPSHLNSPTVLNAALAKSQFWDGSAADVEEQAGGPMQATFEMNMQPSEVVSRLQKIPRYVNDFREVFSAPINFRDVRRAIGAYERTLLTYGSYDRFLEGDNKAISTSAKRGMSLFLSRGCKGCHTGMSIGGQSVQQFPTMNHIFEYARMLPNDDLNLKNRSLPFVNIGGFRGANGKLKYRVPILRNITKTAPYFHNGTIKELDEAIRIMSKYQLGKEFTHEQTDDMVEFLKTLDGDIVKYETK